MPDRKDPLTRKELYEHLISKVCTIKYSPRGSSATTGRFTLLHEHIKELDNFPIGFQTIYETAMIEPHSITALNIDTNQWISIEVNRIKNIQIP